MEKKCELSEAIVSAIGYESAAKLFRVYGGKQVLIPTGSGCAGKFTGALLALIGEADTRKLMALCGGERLTIPKGQAKAMIARNRQIIADYSGGAGMLYLVQRYNLTERRIRSILKLPIEI